MDQKLINLPMRIAFTAVAIVMSGEVCLLSDWIILFPPNALHHSSLDVHLQQKCSMKLFEVESLNWSVFQKYWLNGCRRNECTQRDLRLCKRGKKGAWLNVPIQTNA